MIPGCLLELAPDGVHALVEALLRDERGTVGELLSVGLVEFSPVGTGVDVSLDEGVDECLPGGFAFLEKMGLDKGLVAVETVIVLAAVTDRLHRLSAEVLQLPVELLPADQRLDSELPEEPAGKPHGGRDRQGLERHGPSSAERPFRTQRIPDLPLLTWITTPSIYQLPDAVNKLCSSHPISSRPCRAYTTGCSRPFG